MDDFFLVFVFWLAWALGGFLCMSYTGDIAFVGVYTQVSLVDVGAAIYSYTGIGELIWAVGRCPAFWQYPMMATMHFGLHCG